MKHKAPTLGPWAVETYGYDYEVVVESSLATIASIRPFGGREAANANLIAAAPRLIEALRAVVATEMFLPDHPQRQAAYRNARAAIAKAEGGAA